MGNTTRQILASLFCVVGSVLIPIAGIVLIMMAGAAQSADVSPRSGSTPLFVYATWAAMFFASLTGAPMFFALFKLKLLWGTVWLLILAAFWMLVSTLISLVTAPFSVAELVGFVSVALLALMAWGTHFLMNWFGAAPPRTATVDPDVFG